MTLDSIKTFVEKDPLSFFNEADRKKLGKDTLTVFEKNLTKIRVTEKVNSIRDVRFAILDCMPLNYRDASRTDVVCGLAKLFPVVSYYVGDENLLTTTSYELKPKNIRSLIGWNPPEMNSTNNEEWFQYNRGEFGIKALINYLVKNCFQEGEFFIIASDIFLNSDIFLSSLGVSVARIRFEDSDNKFNRSRKLRQFTRQIAHYNLEKGSKVEEKEDSSSKMDLS